MQFGKDLSLQLPLHESKVDATLFLNPFQVVYMNFARRNLLACLCSVSIDNNKEQWAGSSQHYELLSVLSA